MTRVEVEVEKFKEAFAKFQETSKRSVAQNLRQQAKLLVVDIAKRTPPGDIYGGGWRKGAGETTIKADLAKIMKSSKQPNARTDPQRIHKEHMGRRGRVRTDLRSSGTALTRDGKEIKIGSGDRDRRFRVEATTFRIYLERVKQRVGYMAAGWTSAARFLGGSLPGWISRHSAPGAGTVVVRGTDIEVNLTNAAVYPESRGIVDRRAVGALKKRYWQMVKQADNYMKIAAEQSGFTTGGS